MGKNEYGNLTIGILALQGSVVEHEQSLRRLGANSVRVLSPQDLEGLDGLILPGGESTTLGKLLRLFGLTEPISELIEKGLPVYGTCAGLILLAREIEGEEPHIPAMDIRVRRNAYGRQIDSFETKALIPEFSDKKIPLTFIRAPWIEKTFGRAREIYSLEGHTVAARQGNLLVTSFHPELTRDLSVHGYFADICLEYAAQKRGEKI